MRIVKACGWRGVLGMLAMLAASAVAAEKEEQRDPGSFVRALWTVQRFGPLEAADPRNDGRTKALLAVAVAKDGAITEQAVEKNLMDSKTFQALGGDDDCLKAADLRQALDSSLPETRRWLLPAVAAHLDLLTTSFDRIDAEHLAAGEKLAEWIVANYQPGQPLPIIFVCTGNSRRSMLGATMGNVAAAYWGLPEIRCYSGGTAPSAFNRRTVEALEAIGVEIEPTGQEAPRGAEGSPNPKYLMRWGQAADDDATMETVEFSKRYDDPANPPSGFAAIMVCTQADADCPIVQGASRRISAPYLDPKAYDDSEYEAAKYAERRDDLGRLMLAVLLKSRRQLETAGKIAPATPNAPGS